MTHSIGRLTTSLALSTVATLLLVYLIASSVVLANTLAVVGIGGIFMTADSLQGEDAVIYPEMGRINEDVSTDSTACEQRPMIAINLQAGEISGYSLYKDIELPFMSDRWMSIVVDEPNGEIVSDSEVTIFNTQLEADWLNITNVELTEGGLPYSGVENESDFDDIDRSEDYEPPDNLDGDADGINTDRPRSTEMWGPNSGEFLMVTDPQGVVDDADTEVVNARAWVHGITGESVRFVAGGDLTRIELEYLNTSEIQDRYDSEDVVTRDPGDYNRSEYFDCLPSNN